MANGKERAAEGSGFGLKGIKASLHTTVCLSVPSLLPLPLSMGICISCSCLCTCNLDVTGVDPITIRQSLNTELVTAAL